MIIFSKDLALILNQNVWFVTKPTMEKDIVLKWGIFQTNYKFVKKSYIAEICRETNMNLTEHV